MDLDQEILAQQRSELTEHHIYRCLAKKTKDPHNKKVLSQIAREELYHYKFWKNITKKELRPSWVKIQLYLFLSYILGLSFALRLMENNEEKAQKFYKKVEKKYPKVKKIMEDEHKHEQQLIAILHDKRLTYAGAIVLGLNDALVELTGTLTGLTLAFQNGLLIGVTGLIMGIAASLSMAASGYLSSKEEEDNNKDALTSALYTGVAYFITVLFLVAPYFLIQNVFYAMATMLVIALLIIAAYTKYISVAKDLKFTPRFVTMALISLGVAALSFVLGYAVKTFFGIEV